MSHALAPLAPIKNNSNGLANVMDVSCGAAHTMLLSERGEVFVFGSSADGKMGQGDAETSYRDVTQPLKVQTLEDRGVRCVQISSGSDHVAALSEDGSVWLWGFGQHGTLGQPGENSLKVSNVPLQVNSPDRDLRFSKVSCGMDVTMAMIK